MLSLVFYFNLVCDSVALAMPRMPWCCCFEADSIISLRYEKNLPHGKYQAGYPTSGPVGFDFQDSFRRMAEMVLGSPIDFCSAVCTDSLNGSSLRMV